MNQTNITPENSKSITLEQKIEAQLAKENAIMQSLLLPRDMFQTTKAQLFVSIMMLFLLGMQLYLFFSLHQILSELMSMNI